MTTTIARATALIALLMVLVAVSREVSAHAGPPYPIVSNRQAGPYRISVWTDPDATDDRSPGGQFWVIVDRAGGEAPLPPGTQVRVSIRPIGRPGDAQTVRAERERGNVSRQFAALVMDHEGPFAVQVAVEGPEGEVHVDADVQATYDLRPPPFTLVIYLLPFVLVGGLWLKLLLRRRRFRAR
jgi:hypothetical protein